MTYNALQVTYNATGDKSAYRHLQTHRHKYIESPEHGDVARTIKVWWCPSGYRDTAPQSTLVGCTPPYMGHMGGVDGVNSPGDKSQPICDLISGG